MKYLQLFVFLILINTIKMKVLTMKNAHVYNAGQSFLVLNKTHQITLGAYKPTTIYPEGTYEIFLIQGKQGEEPIEIKVASFYYNPAINKLNTWTRISPPLTWVDIDREITSYAIVIMRKPLRERRSVDESEENKTEWVYKLYVKNKDEKLDNFFIEDEDLVITENFCGQSISTFGNTKTIGAQCPINPETGVQFKECLNWRRTDEVGEKCRKIISDEAIERSIDNFCNLNPTAEDCKCVSRGFQSDYNTLKNYHSDHDYCWYKPCSSGSYLVKDRKNPVKCLSSYCQVIYDTDGKNVNIHGNKNVQNCFNVEASMAKKKNKVTFSLRIPLPLLRSLLAQ